MSVAGLLAQVIASRIRELHWRGEDGDLNTPQGSWKKWLRGLQVPPLTTLPPR